MKLQRFLLPLIVVIAVMTVTMAIPYLISGRPVSLSRVWGLGVAGSTAVYVFSFAGVWVTYRVSKALADVSSGSDWVTEVKTYLMGVGFCGLIALVAASRLGTHQEDADPVFGGGETVVDYEPTDDQRIRHGLIFFFCLCIPSIYGLHESFSETKRKKPAAIHRPQQGGANL